jgi:Tol biopolymer transport system component
MCQYRFLGRLGLLFLVILSGCGLINAERNTQTPTLEPVSRPTLNMPTVTISPTITPLSTLIGTPILTTTGSITEVASPTQPGLTVTETPNCPERRSPLAPSLLQEGSVLFSYDGAGSSSGIWAISATNSVPALVSDGLSGYQFGAVLSPDGASLAYIEYLYEPYMLLIYDMRTGHLVSIPEQEDWRIVRDWLPDGRLKILTDLEEVEMVGLTYYYDLFDPATGATEEMVEVYDLPEFQFDRDRWWVGSAAINPDRTLVLYTAWRNHTTDVVLRDVIENENVWRYDSSYFTTNIPVPSWSADGRNVAFVVEDEVNAIYHIMILDIDTLSLTEIASTGYWIRRLSWSSDTRYLFYSVFESSWREGAGYIIDTDTLEQREICAPGYMFADGYWINGTDQILFSLHSDTSTSVGLLDVSSWEIQTVAELEPDNWVELIGWSLVVLP